MSLGESADTWPPATKDVLQDELTAADQRTGQSAEAHPGRRVASSVTRYDYLTCGEQLNVHAVSSAYHITSKSKLLRNKNNKWALTRRNIFLRHYRSVLFGHDLDLCLLTFEIFAEMPSHVLNISGEFHRNPSTTEISHHTKQVLSGKQRTDGGTDDQMSW